MDGPGMYGLMQATLEARCTLENAEDISGWCPEPLSESLRLCRLIALTSRGSGRTLHEGFMVQVRSLAAAVDDLRATCARAGARLEALGAFLSRARAQKTSSSAEPGKWHYAAISEEIAATVARWDSARDEGADGVTTLRYLLFGTSRVGRFLDCPLDAHVAKAFSMYQGGASGDCVAAYVDEALEQLWTVREATCACGEALGAAATFVQRDGSGTELREDLLEQFIEMTEEAFNLTVAHELIGLLESQIRQFPVAQSRLQVDDGPSDAEPSVSDVESLVRDVAEEMLIYPCGIRDFWLRRALARMSL